MDVVISVLVSEADGVLLVPGNVGLEVFEGVWESTSVVDFVVDFVSVSGSDDDDDAEDVWVLFGEVEALSVDEDVRVGRGMKVIVPAFDSVVAGRFSFRVDVSGARGELDAGGVPLQ